MISNRAPKSLPASESSWRGVTPDAKQRRLKTKLLLLLQLLRGAGVLVSEPEISFEIATDRRCETYDGVEGRGLHLHEVAIGGGSSRSELWSRRQGGRGLMLWGRRCCSGGSCKELNFVDVELRWEA